MNAIFSSDFDTLPDFGEIQDKPTTEDWSFSGSKSLLYSGTVDSYGVVNFSSLAEDVLDISFVVNVPSTSLPFSNFRIIGNQITDKCLDIRLTFDSTDVFLNLPDNANIQIGAADEDIQIRIYVDSSKSRIYINSSITPIEGSGDFFYVKGFGWNQSGGVELFDLSNDEWGPEYYFYLDDLVIQTESTASAVNPSKSGILFPPTLPKPLRASYSTGFEETRFTQDRDNGTARQRRLTRTEPRLEKVTFHFTQGQFRIFDDWWRKSIKSGASVFDIQLTNDVDDLIWYSAQWLGEYRAEIESDRYQWRVGGVLRLTDAGFAVRDSGTEELRGISLIGFKSVGKIDVAKVFYGLAKLKTSAKLKLLNGKLFGATSFTIQAKGSATFGSIELFGLSTLTLKNTASDRNLYYDFARSWGAFNSSIGFRSRSVLNEETLRRSIAIRV